MTKPFTGQKGGSLSVRVAEYLPVEYSYDACLEAVTTMSVKV
ncbi:hypothetical protein H0A61_00759 [Koleobacter methoxysyntrophicus]|jgi:hypothetical protein|uniref:Uncharacterized protein n=1 Tax=Koleobacter methoxysyntrophicus TaxID=2751313 RepID=A0A8A0RLU8_9FIRM|nr:hypothetical protein H0A61_00759 [Koleobacter methoxysyntrophicus]